MDLSAFEKAAEEGSLLSLKDPAGKALLQDNGNPVTIMLAGTESPRWTKAMDNLQNRLMASKEKRDAHDLRNDRASLLAAVTLDWDGIVVDGKPLQYTPAEAKKLYIRFKWLADQVDSFIAAKENFLPASSAD
jgi:hypothetical protein